MIRSVFKLSKFCFAPSCRLFSNKSVTELKSIISSEIEEEKRNYEPISLSEIDDFLKSSGFVFVEEPENPLMKLRKTTTDYEITVMFSAHGPTAQEQPEDDQQDQQAEDFAQFTVLINKTGAPKGILVEGVSENAGITVNQVHYSENIQEYYSNLFAGKVMNSYLGPEFPTLDERVQSTFMNFLSSLGVNEELAAFMEAFALDKDQRLYLSWLGELKSFV